MAELGADPMEAHLQRLAGTELDVTVRLQTLSERVSYTGQIQKVEDGMVSMYQTFQGGGRLRSTWTFRVQDVLSYETR